MIPHLSGNKRRSKRDYLPSDAGEEKRWEQALALCDDQIEFFKNSARRAHWLHSTSEAITIIVTALIPVVLLTEGPAKNSDWPEWLHSISKNVFVASLSAIVAVVSGLRTAFHW